MRSWTPSSSVTRAEGETDVNDKGMSITDACLYLIELSVKLNILIIAPDIYDVAAPIREATFLGNLLAGFYSEVQRFEA